MEVRFVLKMLLRLLWVVCSGAVYAWGGGESEKEFVGAVDLSALPLVEAKGVQFYDADGNPKSLLSILSANGIKAVRLRLWVEPEDGHCGFSEVETLSKRLRALGFNLWLAVHYSDTWADPGHQALPRRWQGISHESLRDSIVSYTQWIVHRLEPDLIQIGNEINSGFLFPYGQIANNEQRFLELLATAAEAARQANPQTRIVIHYAGYKGAEHFFARLEGIDYDIIALSYYPWWHGKDLNELEQTLRRLSSRFEKGILIAETAYPFTLDWNDWTHNTVGLEDQLILPDYPATPEGQCRFIEKLIIAVRGIPQGVGLCYWGGELVAFAGLQSKEGSPWENLALFDFANRALPALRVLGSE